MKRSAKAREVDRHIIAGVFRLTVGPHQLDGVDMWRLVERGLVREMTVLWRPLSAAVAVKKALTKAA